MLCLPPSFSLSFSIALSFPWTPTGILPESRAAWKRGSCGVRWLWGRPSDTSVWFIPLSLQLIASREREKLMVSNKQPLLFHYWLEFWELKFVQSLSSCQKGYIIKNGKRNLSIFGIRVRWTMLTMGVQNYHNRPFGGLPEAKIITVLYYTKRISSQFTAHHQFNKSDSNRFEICCWMRWICDTSGGLMTVALVF